MFGSKKYKKREGGEEMRGAKRNKGGKKNFKLLSVACLIYLHKSK